jgi:AcrR family transcriptional regulator
MLSDDSNILASREKKMTEHRASTRGAASERILSTATELFALYGYNGVSTREIATTAKVNEVTIFRHYSHKRDLYLAVLQTELRDVHLRGDLLARVSQAGDGRAALVRTFELIQNALVQKPKMLRLLQFSVLELKEDFDPLVRTYLGELVEIVSQYLEPWANKGELRCANTKTLILTMVGIFVSYATLQRVFPNQGLSPEKMFQTSADLYAGPAE